MDKMLIVRGLGQVELTNQFGDQLKDIPSYDILQVVWLGNALTLDGDEVGVAHRCRRVLDMKTGRVRNMYVLLTTKRTLYASSRGIFITVPHLVQEPITMNRIPLEPNEVQIFQANAPMSQLDSEMLEEEWRVSMRKFAANYNDGKPSPIATPIQER